MKSIDVVAHVAAVAAATMGHDCYAVERTRQVSLGLCWVLRPVPDHPGLGYLTSVEENFILPDETVAREWTFSYDAQGRFQSITDPMGFSVTVSGYDGVFQRDSRPAIRFQIRGTCAAQEHWLRFTRAPLAPHDSTACTPQQHRLYPTPAPLAPHNCCLYDP